MNIYRHNRSLGGVKPIDPWKKVGVHPATEKKKRTGYYLGKIRVKKKTCVAPGISKEKRSTFPKKPCLKNSKKAKVVKKHTYLGQRREDGKENLDRGKRRRHHNQKKSFVNQENARRDHFKVTQGSTKCIKGPKGKLVSLQKIIFWDRDRPRGGNTFIPPA